MSNLNKIKDRLRALRAKTTAAGCTEAEALAAAEKLADLLTKYGLSHDDIGDADAEGWEQVDIDLGARRRPRDELWGTVAYYCDCDDWLIRTNGARWRAAYFGRPSNVAVATYLHELLERAIVGGLEGYKKEPSYQRRRKNATRRAALKAFEVGMVDRLRLRLGRLKWLRYHTGDDGQTKALVVSYKVPIEAELDRRGMKFGKVASLDHKTRSDAVRDRMAGHVAGNGVALNPGVGAAAPAVAGLIGGAS
jgi:hypothetical protein